MEGASADNVYEGERLSNGAGAVEGPIGKIGCFVDVEGSDSKKGRLETGNLGPLIGRILYVSSAYKSRLLCNADCQTGRKSDGAELYRVEP